MSDLPPKKSPEYPLTNELETGRIVFLSSGLPVKASTTLPVWAFQRYNPLKEPTSHSSALILSKTVIPIGLMTGALSLSKKTGAFWKSASTLRNPSEVETSQQPWASSHRMPRNLSCHTFPFSTLCGVFVNTSGIINGGRRHIPVTDSQSVRMMVA